ncbi:MAG TPA: iron-containing alcohol dehydrogenase family protein [Nakamurella sp.]|nr:iron-containing alcohol dehydrogenase family protein [Nakamurella sp.]
MDIRIPSLLRIKPNALYKLGKYLRKNGFHRIALYYGEGIADLVGQKVEISLDSSEIHVVTEETVHGNDVAEIVSSAFRLPREAQAIVAVGGGVAVDFGKYAGFLSNRPVIAVPTAISNDGFAAPGASLRVDGRRVSCTSTIPFGVVIDTNMIKSSPRRFTFSGIGDLISKYSAIADWKLAYHATGEAINDFSAMISMQSVENLVNHPVKSADDLEFLQLVCGALVMSGVAMEVAGSSRPASGSEHLISHAYDSIAATPSLHGLQVGVATLATTWLQGNPAHPTVVRVLEETGFTAFMNENRLDRAAFLEAVQLAPTIKPGYHTVLSQPGAVERLQAQVKGDPSWDAYFD